MQVDSSPILSPTGGDDRNNVVEARFKDVLSRITRAFRLPEENIMPWFEACCREVPQSEEAFEFVYNQLLNCDLRDLTNNRGTCSFLRTSLFTEENPCPSADIPANIICILQIEEILDVSLNAIGRVKYGRVGGSGFQNPSLSGRRVLKLALSDGYNKLDAGGLRDVASLLVGVETEFIKDLSAETSAGVKIAVRGPCKVRSGVILLRKENVSVLGGELRL